jgi:hypothetical protein
LKPLKSPTINFPLRGPRLFWRARELASRWWGDEKEVYQLLRINRIMESLGLMSYRRYLKINEDSLNLFKGNSSQRSDTRIIYFSGGLREVAAIS